MSVSTMMMRVSGMGVRCPAFWRGTALDGVVALDQLRLVPEIHADEGDLLLIVKCTGW